MIKEKFIKYCTRFVTYGDRKTVEEYCDEQGEREYTTDDTNAVYKRYLTKVESVREVGSACTHEVSVGGYRTTKYYGRVGAKQ